ncbi:unnamed protein product [Calicophoron daubneyi]|uniref:dual-specificity kinase n=1 Tax=Calicophoron daubneyi TaxID=300641 RepID=A0AAV2T0J8_CALDB
MALYAEDGATLALRSLYETRRRDLQAKVGVENDILGTRGDKGSMRQRYMNHPSSCQFYRRPSAYNTYFFYGNDLRHPTHEHAHMREPPKPPRTLSTSSLTQKAEISSINKSFKSIKANQDYFARSKPLSARTSNVTPSSFASKFVYGLPDGGYNAKELPLTERLDEIRTRRSYASMKYARPKYFSGHKRWSEPRQSVGSDSNKFWPKFEFGSTKPNMLNHGRFSYSTESGTYGSAASRLFPCFSSDHISTSTNQTGREVQPPERAHHRMKLSSLDLSLPDSNYGGVIQTKQTLSAYDYSGPEGTRFPSALAGTRTRECNGVEGRVINESVRGNETNDHNSAKSPISPRLALKRYWSKLTSYEKTEILDYPSVYFLGLNVKKRHPEDYTSVSAQSDENEVAKFSCFDDAQSSYVVTIGDHVAYRFEIIKILGKGSFGQVVQAYDHCTGQNVALKIIRSEERFARQAQEEIRILRTLNDRDRNNGHNIVKLLDHFNFRRHVCMVFELLSMNLYELLHRNEFQGISQPTVCKLTRSILQCLELMHGNHIIHCDLKPENVLLRTMGRCSIKVIDFGSSCFEDKRIYTYIQSRFYRAPEVILGMPYGTPIDMWSLGCIVVELITGLPLFPGEDEDDQLACIMEVLDVPPCDLMKKAKRWQVFFSSTGEPRYVSEQRREYANDEEVVGDVENVKEANDDNQPPSAQSTNAAGIVRSRHKSRSHKWKPRLPPGSVDLIRALTSSKRSSVYDPFSEAQASRKSRSRTSRCEPYDPDMLDFIRGCLRWRPEERMNPTEALLHPWITKTRAVSSAEPSVKNTPSVQLNDFPDLRLHLKDLNSSLTSNACIASSGNSEDLLRSVQKVKLRRPQQIVEEEETTGNQRDHCQIVEAGNEESNFRSSSTDQRSIHSLPNRRESSAGTLARRHSWRDFRNGAGDLKDYRSFLNSELPNVTIVHDESGGNLEETLQVHQPRSTRMWRNGYFPRYFHTDEAHSYRVSRDQNYFK